MSEIRGIEGVRQSAGLQRQDRKEAAEGFDAFMKEALGKVNALQDDAQKAIEGLAQGGDITSAMLAMEKADMSFQLMVEVRNRLLSAYEEIMRMQV